MVKNRGTLIAIGGHEDKVGEKDILAEVARRIDGGKMVIATVASSSDPTDLFEEYDRLFRVLGVRHIYRLPVVDREDAQSDAKVRVLDGAKGVFFTGGDQLRITSQIGDTPIYRKLNEIFSGGGVIAGTSAGASVLCNTMLVSGNSQKSARVGDTVKMAPGLGLLNDIIIDQHFAERGRMGRLLGAVAQNPRSLGIGIDEDTAVVVEAGRSFYVLGNGAVYVLDGSTVSASNIADENEDRTLSIYDVRMHCLSQGDAFDLRERQPQKVTGRVAETLPEHELEAAHADES
jgi:cyanophycinase